MGVLISYICKSIDITWIVHVMTMDLKFMFFSHTPDYYVSLIFVFTNTSTCAIFLYEYSS